MYYKNFSYYYDIMMNDIDYDYFICLVEKYISKDKTVLDAGCGTGNILIPLKKEGYNIYGVDYSAEMLSVCKRKLEENNLYVDLYESNLEEDLGTNLFDSVISFLDVINYCDYKKAFKNIYNVLKPNGIFIFDVNSLEYTEKMKGYIEEDEYEEFSYTWKILDNGPGKIKHDLTIYANEVFNEIHYQETYSNETYFNYLTSLGFDCEILSDDNIKVFFKCIKK